MKGYRIGTPEETNAARVLDFEFQELGNTHLRDDLSKFLGVKGTFEVVMGAFKGRYGGVEGVWLTRSKEAAVEYYGRYGGDIEVYDYDPAMVISDLGPDGIFVLKPKFIKVEGEPDE